MIKAVIFDLNGVFLESEYLSDRLAKAYGIDGKAFLQALNQVMAVARKPGVDDSFELWEPHLKQLGLELTRDEFFNFWFSGEQLIVPLLEYVQELKDQGLLVFILSNNFKERTQYYRTHFPEIFNAVHKTYFSWETGYVKSEPEAYRFVLQENNLQPQECLFFDDSSGNIQLAESIGLHAYKYQNFQVTRNTVTQQLTQVQ
jgi:HAD superfamily hydrolase (TIGR01509 family)